MSALGRILFWPTPPEIKPDVLQALESRGTSAVKVILAASYDHELQGRQALIRLPEVTAKRGDMEDWVAWKTSLRFWWLKAGVVFGFCIVLVELIARK